MSRFFENICKLSNITFNQNKQHNQRKDIGHIDSGPGRESNPLSFICLIYKVFKAPSIPAGTEQQIQHTSDGEKVIADNKVFQILNGGSRSQRLNTAQDVKAQNTRHGQQDDYDHIPEHSLFNGTAGQVCGKGNDILEHGDYRRQGRKGHKYKEQSAPQLSPCHMVKYIWKGNEDKGRTGCRLDPISKAGWENDKTGHKSN